MATLVVVGEDDGDDDVDVDVDVVVDDYGSTHGEDRVVPSGMMMDYLRSPLSWKTKKASVVLLGILGVTAVVASGYAAMIFPSIVTSSEPARTDESFLLHDGSSRLSWGKCVATSGPWPSGTLTLRKGDMQPHPGYNMDLYVGPGYSQRFVSCFSLWVKTKHMDGFAYEQCWSESVRVLSGLGNVEYYGEWYQTCEPEGYERGVWEYGTPQYVRNGETPTCGTSCTTFEQRDVQTGLVHL